MKAAKARFSQTRARRRPKQLRARRTVEAVLDSVVRILKREGPDAVSTNHIAEVAGVSIGSVYQYFPDKRAIFVALHRRHVEEIDLLVEKTLVENATASLETLIRSMMDAMVRAHARDPELYDALYRQVPHQADGTKDFSTRLYRSFRLALAARARELKPGRDLTKVAFVLTHLIDALSHGAVLRRPADVSLADAKQEAVLAILAYLLA